MSLLKSKDKNIQKEDDHGLNVLRYQQTDTIRTSLQCSIQTDHHFIQDVRRISSIKEDLITNFINYKKAYHNISDQVCDQIDYKARIHWDANIINTNSSRLYDEIQPSLRCQCGCRRTKGKPIQILADQQKLTVLGPGVILHFMYLKAVMINLCLAIIIYGIFAVTTNLCGDYTSKQCKVAYCVFQGRTSNQTKLNPLVNQEIQEWLGLIFCIFWVIGIRIVKSMGKDKAKFVDDRLKTTSDFTVKIDNLPQAGYTENELLEYLDQLWHQKNDKEGLQQPTGQINQHKMHSESLERITNKWNVRSIQVVYNLEWSRKMVEEIFEQSKVVNDLLGEGDGIRNMIKNVDEYRQGKSRLCRSYELLKDLRKKFLNEQQFRKNLATSCCIIEFHNRESKDFFLKYYGDEKATYLKTIKQRIKKLLFPGLKLTLFKGKTLQIIRAPEPTDILWHNCQKGYSILRITLIHTITAVIVILSFFIIAALTIFKDVYTKNSLANNSIQLFAANIAIVIALQLVNKIIWFVLFYILQFEYNHCVTDKIVSQMHKTLLATSVNFIVVPFISTYVIRGKLYGTDGLVGVAFDYQVSFLAVAFVNTVDPLELVKRFVLWVRIFRNLIIRFLCAKIHQLNPQKGIPEVNWVYEGPYFDIAENYVKVTGAIFHAAFFCRLQPFLLFLVIVMILIFYVLTKYKLYRICKIPDLTDYMVFSAAINQANFVPIVYAAGTILISYLQSSHNPQKPLIIIPAFVCLALGVLNITNPGGICNIIATYLTKIYHYSKSNSTGINNLNPVLLTCVKKSSIQRSSITTNTLIVNRNQTYFEDSNALVLLGFECILKGESVKTISKQLVNFCEHFLDSLQLSNYIHLEQKIYTQNFEKTKDFVVQSTADTKFQNSGIIIWQN